MTKTHFPFEKLGVGDSFLIGMAELDLSGPEGIRQIVYRYGILHNKKFKTRLLKESGQTRGMQISRTE